MIQVLNQVLAFLFDKLKASSPIAATITLAILGGLYAIANALPATILPEWGQQIVEWIVIIYAALSGSRTSRFIQKAEVKKS